LVDDPDLIKQTDDRNAQRKNMQEDENNAIAFNQYENKKRELDHVDEANEQEADLFRNPNPDHSMEQGNENRMVYVPK